MTSPRKKKRHRRSAASSSRFSPDDPRYFSRFKVLQLSPPAQAAVFRGLARGDSYPRIVAAVAQLGGSVSRHALLRFRGKAWQHELHRLQRARAKFHLLRDALVLDPDSPSAQIAQELLYTAVCDKLSQNDNSTLLTWLREAREQSKATGKKDSAPATRPAPLSPAELQRRIREIYGLPPDEPDA